MSKTQLKRSQVKELFRYAVADKSKWSLNNKDPRWIVYNFGGNRFEYNGITSVFYQEGESSRLIASTIPLTFVPYSFPDDDIGASLFLMALYTIFLYFILAPISYALIAIGIHYGLPLELGHGHVLLYNFSMFPILFLIMSVIFQILNWKNVKYNRKAHKIRKEIKRKIREEKEEEENQLFNELVDAHFLKQSRKAKLEKLDE